MRITWRRRALLQVDSIEIYISHDNPAAARAMEQRIRVAVDHLATHPGLGLAGHVPNTRELVVTGTPYVVAYAVRQDEIEIIAVLHGNQKWPSSF